MNEDYRHHFRCITIKPMEILIKLDVVSECCNSSVKPVVKSERFEKLDNEKDTWALEVSFLCDKCLKICYVKEIEHD